MGTSGGIRTRNGGLQSPNGDIRRTLNDESHEIISKESSPGDNHKTGPNKSRTRPTSLPLCLGGRSGVAHGHDSHGEQRTIQSCLVVDSNGVRTVLCQQQGPHQHRHPTVLAENASRHTNITSNSIVPITPGCSPPAYDVAIEMQVPSQLVPESRRDSTASSTFTFRWN